MDGAMATGVRDWSAEYTGGANPVPRRAVGSMPQLLWFSGMRGGL